MAYPYLTDFVNEIFGTHIHIPIATFGTFVGIAILVAIQFMKGEVNRLTNMNHLSSIKIKDSNSLVTEIAFATTIAGLVGAKLFDILEHPGKFIDDPLGQIFSTGGFSIYGGLILGAITGIIFVKRKSIPVLPMLDAAAPALAIGYGIGRIGCQLSGDGDWGKPAIMELKPIWLPDWFWAQTYPNNVLNVDIPAPGVYPTPIYEAVGALFIFIVLWKIRKQLTTAGHLFFTYLILSALARWLVETIRINPQYEIMGTSLSQAQLISVVLVVIGFSGYAIVKKKTC